MDWAYSTYRKNQKNAYKILIECEAKKLFEGTEKDRRKILKMVLIKSNRKAANYIYLVQRADNGLSYTAINLHVP
jgi:hypothetical protein